MPVGKGASGFAELNSARHGSTTPPGARSSPRLRAAHQLLGESLRIGVPPGLASSLPDCRFHADRNHPGDPELSGKHGTCTHRDRATRVQRGAASRQPRPRIARPKRPAESSSKLCALRGSLRFTSRTVNTAGSADNARPRRSAYANINHNPKISQEKYRTRMASARSPKRLNPRTLARA
jgi:hypothetical protein